MSAFSRPVVLMTAEKKAIVKPMVAKCEREPRIHRLIRLWLNMIPKFPLLAKWRQPSYRALKPASTGRVTPVTYFA